MLSLNQSNRWSTYMRAGCSSVDSVPAFEAVGRRIDPSQWYPAAVWAIFRSNQWSTTGLSKAVVCTVLSI